MVHPMDGSLCVGHLPMGDFADDILDHMFDRMLYGEEYEDSWAGPRSITCRRCQTQGLTWAKGKDRWTLVDERGNIHRCPVNKSAIQDFLNNLG